MLLAIPIPGGSTVAAVIILLTAIIAIVWIAVQQGKNASKHKERDRQSKEAMEARERYEKKFGKSRGGALDRARKRVRKSEDEAAD